MRRLTLSTGGTTHFLSNMGGSHEASYARYLRKDVEAMVDKVKEFLGDIAAEVPGAAEKYRVFLSEVTAKRDENDVVRVSHGNCGFLSMCCRMRQEPTDGHRPFIVIYFLKGNVQKKRWPKGKHLCHCDFSGMLRYLYTGV
jgi:hypothetical protein